MSARTAPGILCVAANPSVDRTYEVERLVAGEIHRPLLAEPRPGGKGLNVARAAHAIGGRVTALALLGGHQGAWIRERLEAAGVEARIVEVSRETRTCISILDRTTGRMTELYERGEAVRAEEWAGFERAAAEALGAAGLRVMTLSGSLPPGAPVDGFARLASLAAAAGVAVLADVHGEPLRAVLAASPTVVKVNEAEARALVDDAGGPAAADPEALASGLRARGARHAVVTLGAAGALGVGPDGRPVAVPPPREPGRFPVGSGDAFLAGLAVAWADGASLGDALRHAAAAAEANATVAGPGDLDLARYRAALTGASAGPAADGAAG